VKRDPNKAHLQISNILESITDAFLAYDQDWRFTYVNAAAEKILGSPRENLLGNVHWDVCPYTIDTDIERLYHQVMESREPAEMDYHHQHKDRWFNTWLSLKVFPADEGGGIAVYFRDITQQKQAEEALRESEELYRLITDSSTDLIGLIDFQGKVIFVSPSVRQVMGLEPEQVVGTSAFDRIHPEDAPASLQSMERALAGKTVTFLHRARYADGSWRWLDGWGKVVQFRGQPHVLAVSRDITERKRAEESLTLFRSLLDQTNDSIEVIDPESGRFLDVNEKACQACGYTRDEYLQLRVPDIDPQVAARPWAETRDEVRRHGSRIMESQHRRKDGSLFPVEVNVTFVRLERDYFLAVVRDISERKQIEESFRRLSQAIEQSPVSIVITDISGAIEYVNPHFCAMTGYSQEEVLGRNSRILKSGETTAKEYRQLWQTISSGGVWRGEFHNRRKTGELFWELATVAPLRNADHVITHYVAIKEDITEHKVLEEQFRQAQKIESVGRLAGGVAHDFNNMLGVIIGRTEMALNKLNPDEPLFASLQEIHKAAERSANLTRQLLAFARKQTIAPRKFDLNQTVAGMLKMLRRLIGEDIDLAWLPDAGELPVKMDPSQLDQILANLCVNARDAITGVGKVTIETHSTTFDDAYCSTHPEFVPGDFVQLVVSDNGSGIDHETLGQIFEPYFTTKELGKGTGLGLATVYGIVRQNNGFINVYSEPDRGTTFKIYLPWHSAGSDPQEKQARVPTVAQGDETILLVEDELSYLDITRQMLESFGYRVLTAAAPGEALRIARDYADEIHLLLTDVIMPEMNGRDLAVEMNVLFPQIKFLFMSGYTSDVIAHHGILDAGVKYIQKPFSLQDLAVKVREALEGG